MQILRHQIVVLPSPLRPLSRLKCTNLSSGICEWRFAERPCGILEVLADTSRACVTPAAAGSGVRLRSLAREDRGSRPFSTGASDGFAPPGGGLSERRRLAPAPGDRGISRCEPRARLRHGGDRRDPGGVVAEQGAAEPGLPPLSPDPKPDSAEPVGPSEVFSLPGHGRFLRPRKPRLRVPRPGRWRAPTFAAPCMMTRPGGLPSAFGFPSALWWWMHGELCCAGAAMLEMK